jgi:transposase
MEFRELSGFEWEVIKPLLPPRSKSFRRIIIRYEKLASTYKAIATITSITIP